jgi:hypothetical protein
MSPLRYNRVVMLDMTIRRSVVLVLLALVAACGGSTKTSSPPAAPSNTAADEAHATVVGSWREFWGTPGETDVTYHDEYKVEYQNGQPVVVPLKEDHPDVINAVTIDGDNLDLRIQTAFEVHYQLHLDPGGATMSGTATTPDKVVPIRWERITD